MNAEALFKPGRFSPVIEICVPEEFEDNTFEDFPASDFAYTTGTTALLGFRDSQTTCCDNFEPVVEQVPNAWVSDHLSLRDHSGDITTMDQHTFFACPCALKATQLLAVPLAFLDIVSDLKHHRCLTCAVCSWAKKTPSFSFVDTPGRQIMVCRRMPLVKLPGTDFILLTEYESVSPAHARAAFGAISAEKRTDYRLLLYQKYNAERQNISAFIPG